MSDVITRSRSSFGGVHSISQLNEIPNSSTSESRSRSPGKLLMQVHDRLIEESKSKDALTHELISIKRRVEEFSIRLDFILKCMFSQCSHNVSPQGSPLPHTCVVHVKELNDELNNFVMHSCMTRNDDLEVISDAYHSIKKLFDRSEEERLQVEAERNDLLRKLARMSIPCAAQLDGADAYEEEAERILSNITSLRDDLARKQMLIDELKRAHDSQLHKIESINREEVRNLREALANATAHSDRWKSMYLADVTRLRDELTKGKFADTVHSPKRPISRTC